MEFNLTPASSGALMTLGLISVVMVALGVMFMWITWSASHASITIADRAIHQRIPFYGRMIPISNINLAQARVLSLDESAEIKAVRRTNGIGLPGYATGWFKLASGEKALLAVTRGRVLFIPTNEGYSVWLSVAQPEAALRQLRSAGGA
jgi:Bacterial PH domain